MSRFNKEFKGSMKGEFSFESNEVTEDLGPVAEITPEIVIQTQEERTELADALDHVDEIGDDRTDIEASMAVTQAITDAVQAAETMPQAASETFTEIANVTIASAAQVLDIAIPPLETDPQTGAITEASMESIGSWFEGAARSFMEASASFFGRIGLGLSRLNDSSQGLTKRCMRTRTLMGQRKGNGGKPLKLPSGVLRQLVLADNYAASPVDVLNTFAGLNTSLTKIVEIYHTRLAAVIKDRIFAAVASGQKNDIFIDLQTADLLEDLEKLIAQQPKVLMGNQRYDFNGRKINKVLTVTLAAGTPDAIDLIRHLDAPNSLSNEAINQTLLGLEALIGEQLLTLERITSGTKASFKNLQVIIGKFNNIASDEEKAAAASEGSEPVAMSSLELLRIENQLVSELGRVCDRLVDYQRDLIDRIDTVLTLVEESVFQD